MRYAYPFEIARCVVQKIIYLLRFELNFFSLFLNPTDDFLYLYCEYFRYVLLGGLDFSPLYSIRTRTRSILTGQCSPCPCSSCRVHCSQICSIKADEEQGRNNSKFKLFMTISRVNAKKLLLFRGCGFQLQNLLGPMSQRPLARA